MLQLLPLPLTGTAHHSLGSRTGAAPGMQLHSACSALQDALLQHASLQVAGLHSWLVNAWLCYTHKHSDIHIYIYMYIFLQLHQKIG